MSTIRFRKIGTPDKDLATMTPHEAAAYWLVREDAGALSAVDRRELESWLSGADTHRRAYEQTLSMWKDFESAADESELRALRVAALSAGPTPKVWARAAAIAVGFIGTAILGALTWHVITGRPAPSVTASTGTVSYTTAHNQRSTVTLSDGTVVSMNLDTTLFADLTGVTRHIRLERGQAFFEVAKDPRRPFSVAAGGQDIRALGTQFDVRLDADRVEVVLLEGKVRVDRNNPSLFEKLVYRSKPVELTPNERLVATPDESPSVTKTNAAQATSWREGWAVFQDETVEQAIAELNRYSEKPIVVSNDEVRRMRLSGVFRIGQPDRFASIIQELLPITAERGQDGETVLTPRVRRKP